jgi:hypothetical protein
MALPSAPVVVKLTRGEFNETVRVVRRRRGAAPFVRLGLILVALSVFATVLVGWSGHELLNRFALNVLMIVVVYGALRIAMPFLAERITSQYSFDENGFTRTRGSQTSRYAWDEITETTRTDELIILWRGRRGVVLPTRCFASPAAADAVGSAASAMTL